jgi:hypothetical protein
LLRECIKEHIYFFFLLGWCVSIKVQRITEAGTGAGIEEDDEEEEVE